MSGPMNSVCLTYSYSDAAALEAESNRDAEYAKAACALRFRKPTIEYKLYRVV